MRDFKVFAAFNLTVRVSTHISARSQDAAEELAQNWADNYRLALAGGPDGQIDEHEIKDFAIDDVRPT